MDLDGIASSPKFNGLHDDKYKMSEEEMKWESAGQFQPGKLKTMFHDFAKDAPVIDKPVARPKSEGRSRYDWMKNEADADRELLVPHKLNVDLEVKQRVAKDDRQLQEAFEVESEPEPLRENKREVVNHQDDSRSESDSDSEDERRPRVESDEYHKLTEEELKWEGARHFQPSRLNTSLFTEFDKPSAAREESPRSTKNKKMLDKQNKEEIVVSDKFDHGDAKRVDVIESGSQQGDRSMVGKLQQFKVRDFEEGGEVTADMKRRQLEEERRKTEQEEIRRAKEEERRRQQEEEEDSQQEEEFPDDEFELKVKTKAVNKIDRSLLGQFLKEDRKEQDILRKRSPQEKKFIQEEPVPVAETLTVVESQPVESTPYEAEPEHNETFVKESDLPDDEFERKIQHKKIGRINLKSSPFHGKPEEVPHSVQRKKPEARRSDVDGRVVAVNLVHEESVPFVETLEVVESEPVEVAPSDELSADDIFERKVQEKKIGKINLGSIPFGGNKTEEPSYDVRRKRREERRPEEDVQGYVETLQESAPSDRTEERSIETSPRTNELDFEDDEFELKVKKKDVKKLDLAQFEFKQKELEEKEHRLRQLEEERRKKEREEKEQLRKEEERRRLQLEAEARARAEEEERMRQEEEELERRREEDKRRQEYESNAEVIIIEDGEPKSVGKLDPTKFSHFQQKSPTEAKPPAKPPRKNDLVVNQSSEETVIQSEVVSETRSAPNIEAFENGVEEIDYEEKRKEVRRLDKDWYFRQQQLETGEAERKARHLEEERRRLEREEIERSRQEEKIKKSSNSDEDVSVTFELDSASPDKPTNVGRLNLNKFSQFQQSDMSPRNTQKQHIEYERQPKAKPQEVIVESNDVEVESSPYEADFQESEPSGFDKPRNVNKLSESHLAVFNRADTQAKPNTETPEKSRKGSIKAQQERSPNGGVVQVQEITVKSAPQDVDEEMDYELKLKDVKKLDVDRFMQSRKEEVLERERRKKQLEEERSRIEKKEMEERKKEERRRSQKFTEDQVDGGDDQENSLHTEVAAKKKSKTSQEKAVEINGDAEQDEKRKSVGRLSFDQFSQFQQAEIAKEKEKKEQKPKQDRRRSDDRSRRYVIEYKEEPHPKEEINNNTYTHSTSRNRESQGDKVRMDGEDLVETSPSEEISAPKKLPRNMFVAFEGDNNKKQHVTMRRAKSEMQLRPKSVTIVERNAWQDDDTVIESRRRKEEREQKRKARPKTIAFIDTSMFEK